MADETPAIKRLIYKGVLAFLAALLAITTVLAFESWWWVAPIWAGIAAMHFYQLVKLGVSESESP